VRLSICWSRAANRISGICGQWLSILSWMLVTSELFVEQRDGLLLDRRLIAWTPTAACLGQWTVAAEADRRRGSHGTCYQEVFGKTDFTCLNLPACYQVPVYILQKNNWATFSMRALMVDFPLTCRRQVRFEGSRPSPSLEGEEQRGSGSCH
jgi:hypothetical protein